VSVVGKFECAVSECECGEVECGVLSVTVPYLGNALTEGNVVVMMVKEKKPWEIITDKPLIL